MIEEVYKNIYRIGVPIVGNPLKELNCYLIRSDEGDLLIDTGFRNEQMRGDLMASLEQLGSRIENRSVLITHMHGDHSGMADWFGGQDKPVLMGEADMEYQQRFLFVDGKDRQDARFREEGMSDAIIYNIRYETPVAVQTLEKYDHRFTPVKEGQCIQAGDYSLECINVPGHTPGNCMYYIRDKKIMFTGDHVLFDITPNIVFWPGMEDPLGEYIKSLKKSRQYEVDLALPGHRKTGNYAERVEQILEHHQNRLEDTYRIICENPGMTAYDIAARMKWKIRAANFEEFPNTQKWFALGECVAHIDYLKLRGRIRKEQGEKANIYYAV